VNFYRQKLLCHELAGISRLCHCFRMTVETNATLATKVYRRLRLDLLEGRIAPGEKLKVHSLAAQCGAGASPVREALAGLAAEGLVLRVDQRGFRAAELTAAEFADLLHARCWTEEVAFRESIARGSAAWEEALVVASWRLSQSERRSPIDHTWEAAHGAFHQALLAACPSETLLSFIDSLRERAARYRLIAGTAGSYAERDIAAEHKAIADAALARRPAEACRLLLDHFRTTGEYLARALAEQEATHQRRSRKRPGLRHDA
jgi:GntR family transcriptional regulator, carbon starvation induced regulator